MNVIDDFIFYLYLLGNGLSYTCNMQFISYGSIIILLSLYFPLLLNMICMIASLEEGKIKFKTRTSVEPKPYIPYNEGVKNCMDAEITTKMAL